MSVAGRESSVLKRDCSVFDRPITVSKCAGMLRETTHLPDDYIPPKSRPLLDQLDLAYRLVIARCSPEPSTWEDIAKVEGIPKRTLQHFHRTWLEGVGAPTKRRRTERPSERNMDRLLRYYSVYH